MNLKVLCVQMHISIVLRLTEIYSLQLCIILPTPHTVYSQVYNLFVLLNCKSGILDWSRVTACFSPSL